MFLYQTLDHIGIQGALGLFDAFVERLFSVIVEDTNRLLRQNRTSVDLFGHEVHRAARDLHAGRERVAHRVPNL